MSIYKPWTARRNKSELSEKGFKHKLKAILCTFLTDSSDLTLGVEGVGYLHPAALVIHKHELAGLSTQVYITNISRQIMKGK